MAASDFCDEPLKVAVTAFVGTIMLESVASNDGIGYLMMSAAPPMRISFVFAGPIVVAAMAMYAVFAGVERHMTGLAHRGQHA